MSSVTIVSLGSADREGLCSSDGVEGGSTLWGGLAVFVSPDELAAVLVIKRDEGGLWEEKCSIIDVNPDVSAKAAGIIQGS